MEMPTLRCAAQSSPNRIKSSSQFQAGIGRVSAFCVCTATPDTGQQGTLAVGTQGRPLLGGYMYGLERVCQIADAFLQIDMSKFVLQVVVVVARRVVVVLVTLQWPGLADG